MRLILVNGRGSLPFKRVLPGFLLLLALLLDFPAWTSTNRRTSEQPTQHSVGTFRVPYYLFTPSEGDIVRDEDYKRSSADEFRKICQKQAQKERLEGIGKGKLEMETGAKSYYVIERCKPNPSCELVMVHAEQKDKKIVCKLKFKLLPKSLAKSLPEHPEESKDKSCPLQEGTTENECLQVDLQLLVPELINHLKKYHGWGQ